MTLEWILSEIKDLESAPNTAKSVYDLAALLIVRDHFQTPNHELVSSQENLRSDLSIDDIEEALGAVMISSDEERKRAQDARMWIKIIRGES